MSGLFGRIISVFWQVLFLSPQVFHSFHDEVDVYRQHIWQCNGPCRSRRPYFGLVKRSMNRAPGPNDNWWAHHQQTCGGTYTKIQEPDRSATSKKGSKTASKYIMLITFIFLIRFCICLWQCPSVCSASPMTIQKKAVSSITFYYR